MESISKWTKSNWKNTNQKKTEWTKVNHKNAKSFANQKKAECIAKKNRANQKYDKSTAR